MCFTYPVLYRVSARAESRANGDSRAGPPAGAPGPEPENSETRNLNFLGVTEWFNRNLNLNRDFRILGPGLTVSFFFVVVYYCRTYVKAVRGGE